MQLLTCCTFWTADDARRSLMEAGSFGSKAVLYTCRMDDTLSTATGTQDPLSPSGCAS